ncbi:AtpZ/AtpI family protein [Methylosinus sp. PW1]|uniref:AtpZ/AtpI family protein n=1 Tax=Methylosinus sp. PW1 TaxID=107636 RepID=UPI00055A6E5F|nr:AtpZ/AtpI family protein [Methylosinus sp. PW1]
MATDKNVSDRELRARLERLQAELGSKEEERRAETGGGLPVGGSFGKALSAGFTVLSEFVAAILVATLIGWQADRWFGTGPWLLILFLGLGVAAGFYNVFRFVAPKDARGGG